MRTSPGGSVTDSSWRSTWSRRPVSARAGTGSTSGGSSAERIWGSESTTARTPERRRKGPGRRRQLSGPGVAEAGDHVVPAFIVGAALRCVRLPVIQGGGWPSSAYLLATAHTSNTTVICDVAPPVDTARRRGNVRLNTLRSCFATICSVTVCGVSHAIGHKNLRGNSYLSLR